MPARSATLCPPRPILDNAGVYRFNRGPLNFYDSCLIDDRLDWDTLTRDCPPLPYCTRPKSRHQEPPWITMPENGKRFQARGTLSVDGNFTGLDISLLDANGTSGPLFICDTGYDGVITEIVMTITGPGGTGFVSGSGSVIWRLGVDQGQPTNSSLYYFRDYGNVTMALGSLTQPSTFVGNGERIISQQRISMWVNLPVASLAIITPGSIIIGAVGGWTYPR